MKKPHVKKLNIPTETKYHLTPVSANKKTGPIAVTTTGRQSCPPTCSLYGRCYATTTSLHFHWNHVTYGHRGTDWEQHLNDLRDIPSWRSVRFNQAGDLPGDGVTIDAKKLAELADILGSKSGRAGPAWTYTHKPMTKANAAAVRAANDSGFVVNLSADNMRHADELADTKAGPVVVIMQIGSARTVHTPAGRKVVMCPAQRSDTVTCETCLLCAKGNRSVIVGFEAHAVNKKTISEIASR